MPLIVVCCHRPKMEDVPVGGATQGILSSLAYILAFLGHAIPCVMIV